jgi:ribosome-associated translation inhibitor RaiA
MPTAEAQTKAAVAARPEWDVAVQMTVDRRGEKADVERVVRRKIASLRRQFPDISSCRVMIDVPHRRQRSGRLHRVRIGIVLHGSTVRATRSPSLATHEDALVAIHDAFAAVHREMSERAHRHEEKRRTK